MQTTQKSQKNATEEVRKRRFTVEEFQTMYRAGVFGDSEKVRVELLDGEVFENMTPMGSRHAACIDRLNRILGSMSGKDTIVRVQCPIRLDDASEPEPDISLLKFRDDFYATAHPKPDDVLLAVEVSDTTLAFDTNVKLPAYAKAGIPEVWIIDLSKDTIHVHTNPTSDGYRNTTRAGKRETFESGAVSGEMKASDILG